MLEAAPAAQPALQRVERVALIIGIVGLVFGIIGLVVNPSQFFQSYLVAFLYCFGLTGGCLGILMIHYIGGGKWGAAIGDIARSGSSLFWLVAIMFIPVIIGAGYLYPWTNPAVMNADPLLKQKEFWLNLPVWIIRAIIYFAGLILISRTLLRWFQQWDETGDPAVRRRLRNLSGGGVVFVVLAVSFACFDWIMSLEPSWSSTIYGLMISAGFMVSGWAICIFTMTRLRNLWPLRAMLSWENYRDVGSFMLATLIVWGYFSFDQFMLIWIGNLNDEIPWYLVRMSNGWQNVGLYLIIVQFFVCFFMLVQRGTRKNPTALGIVAALLLFGHLVELTMMVEPEFPPNPLVNHWQDLALFLGLGGIWVMLFTRQLQQRVAVVRPAAIFEEHGEHAAPSHGALGAE
jgi:hypothetical protein